MLYRLLTLCLPVCLLLLAACGGKQLQPGQDGRLISANNKQNNTKTNSINHREKEP